jgi:hypothetical protein
MCIAAAVLLVLGFIVGENVAAAFTGTFTSYGEPAGTFQTYGGPIEDLLVRLVEASMFHILGRILLFAASPLSILLMLAIHFVMRRSTSNINGPYRFLSLVGLGLGIAAATIFAISHVLIGPLSLDIANQYSEASTDSEKTEIVTTAYEIDKSIGLTVLDNIFIDIGVPLMSISFLTFGLAMVKARMFERLLGWLSMLFGILGIIAFMGGNLAGLGGVAPTTYFR